MHIKHLFFLLFIIAGFALVGCSDDDSTGPDLKPLDPDMAPKVSVDRFSMDAGHLFIRDATNGFPAENVAIDFDQAPFITKGLGPNGEIAQYYNFDVQPLESAPIFVLFKEGESSPVAGQLNIIDVIPGDMDYNDFWHVHKVTVPTDYEANTLTSVEKVMDSGYDIEKTTILVNCPVVPEGSTAMLRYGSGSNGLTRGWYKDQVVFYFEFGEKQYMVTPPAMGHPIVPLSDILVAFNINPGQTGGGPPSGFLTETGTDQTHNVLQTLPTDANYSALWNVNIYDNADFNNVSDWQSAQNATLMVPGAALVNCPVVSVD